MFKQEYSRKLSHSQNFLRDPKFVEELITRCNFEKNDVVIEIGPGRGMITKLLSQKIKQLFAIEVDEKLAIQLRSTLHDATNIKLINTDFLKWELPKEQFKIFSNIPFNMTADIIRKLTGQDNLLEVAYLIVQDKAAERFVGQPLAKETQMSILLKPSFEITVVSRINRNQFVPRPSVDAVLLKIRRREKTLILKDNLQKFRDFVIYGFNQWKPNIIEAFDNIFNNQQSLLIKSQLKIVKQKPSELTFDQWLQLFKVFLLEVTFEKQHIVYGSENKLLLQQQKLTKMYRTR